MIDWFLKEIFEVDFMWNYKSDSSKSVISFILTWKECYLFLKHFDAAITHAAADTRRKQLYLSSINLSQSQ